MKPLCPSCNQVIPAASVNIHEAIGHCIRCNEVFRIDRMLIKGTTTYRSEKPSFSKIESYIDRDSMGLIIPPEGFKGTAIFLLLFSLFWNAISWTMFIATIAQGEWLGTLFLSIFVTVGAFVLVMFLYTWKGVFSFELDEKKCHAIWSVFKFRYMKTVQCADIHDVIEDVVYTKNYQPMHGVSIKYGSNKAIKFGASMSDDERVWCVGEIRHFLQSKGYLKEK